MKYFNDVCCMCLSSKIDLRELQATDKDGVTYYEILVACIPEMFEFLEANHSYRRICLSCCNIVDVVFKLYQNYLRSKTILLDHIKKLHETVANCEDILPSTNDITDSITIEENQIKTEIIDLDEEPNDVQIKIEPNDIKEEINSQENVSDTNRETFETEEGTDGIKRDITDVKDDDDDELQLCEPVVILEEMSNDATLPEQTVGSESKPPNWDLTCIACHKKFPTKTNLLKHQKLYCNWKEIRRPRGRPPKIKAVDLTCKVCNRKFRYINALRVHERLHTGELPYGCDVCKKRFRQISNYNYHMVKHHGKKMTGGYKRNKKKAKGGAKEKVENDA